MKLIGGKSTFLPPPPPRFILIDLGVFDASGSVWHELCLQFTCLGQPDTAEDLVLYPYHDEEQGV